MFLLLLAFVAAASGQTVYSGFVGTGPGYQVPYPPDPSQNTQLYLNTLAISFINSTVLQVISSYYYSNQPSNQKGYLNPMIYTCSYAIQGTGTANEIFISCVPGGSCSNTPSLGVNLCANDALAQYYTGPRHFQAVNSATNTLAIAIGDYYSQSFAGLPIATTLYCQGGSCPLITV